MRACLLLALALPSALCQLRPRRVGTGALGDQEAVLTDVPAGAGAAAADPMAGLAEMMKGMKGQGAGGAGDPMAQINAGLEAMKGMMGGEGGLDLGALLKNADLTNNPMMKAMADSNPEIAKMLNDPDALQEQVQKVTDMMTSPEGSEMANAMMKEMADVMTNPDKLKAGLEQLGSNPALKGFADAVPGLRDVLDNPEQLQEQATKAAEMFQSFQDPEKAKELLGALAGGEGGANVMEGIQKMMEGLGKGGSEGLAGLEGMQEKIGELLGGDGLADLMRDFGGGDDGGALDPDEGGDGDDLKARVRAQLAQMMASKRAAGGGEEGGLGLDDEESF